MMPKIYLLGWLLGFVLAMGVGYAQEKKSSAKFKSERPGRTAEQALKEAENLKEKNPSAALDRVEEALGHSLVNNEIFYEAKSYVLLGEINERINEWKLALENFTTAYQKLSKDYRNTPEFIRTLKGLGNTNLKLGFHSVALQYLEEGLTLSLPGQTRTEFQFDLSEVYFQMTRYDEALKILDEIPGNKKVVDAALEARIQNQKAKILARENDLEKTQNMYLQSVNTLRGNRVATPEEEQELQKTKAEIVDVLREQKRYDEEINLRKQAITFNLESKNMAEVTKDKVEIGKTLAAKGENIEALKTIEEAVALADTLDDPREQAHAFLTLADLYEKNGRSREALKAYKKYSEAVDRSEKQNEVVLTEKSNLIKKQRDIEEYTKSVSIGQHEATIQKQTLFRQQLIIYGLIFIISIVVTTSFFIYKNARASKIANQLLALKSLRSQMNPHFIFNALNSVNHFISQQDERTANKFLSEFSQLMRLVLENSQNDFIPLSKEQEILSLYLKLEQYRFRDKFDYSINIDPAIDGDSVEVPPMLIQPYIENAVWHGLRYKETKGNLTLTFQKNSHDLIVEITDDGIGREKSAALKTANQKKHHSTGIKNIQERLNILNHVYRSNYRVFINDLPDGKGTSVKIFLPVRNSGRALETAY